MTTTVEAVYEKGVLRPLSALPLSEGQRVQVLLSTEEAVNAPSVGSLLAEIAALPVERAGDPSTGRDHDRILYSGDRQP